MRFNRTREQGRSMIEMLGVLGIMSIITVLSISAYKISIINIKVNNTKNDLAIIRQRLVAKYSNLNFEPLGMLDFTSLFIDTGFMKDKNAFGKIRTDTGEGYSLRGRNSHTIYASLKSNQYLVAIWGLEEEECNILSEQDYVGALDKDLIFGTNENRVCIARNSDDYGPYWIFIVFEE